MSELSSPETASGRNGRLVSYSQHTSVPPQDVQSLHPPSSVTKKSTTLPTANSAP